MAWLTILTELLGGFAVLLGAFVTPVSVPMAVVLLTSIFSVIWRYSFSFDHETPLKFIKAVLHKIIFAPEFLS